MSPIESLIAELVRQVAAAVVAELRSGDAPGMVDQSASPLGRRRHMKAVRRRVAAGEPGAAHVGRRFMLSREALDAELTTESKRAARKAKPAPVDDLAALRSRYGLQRRAS